MLTPAQRMGMDDRSYRHRRSTRMMTQVHEDGYG